VIHYRPWEEIYIEFFNAKKDAMEREKYLKTGVDRKWIHSQLL